MSLHRVSSANRLYSLLPEGMVASTAWLGRQGFSRQLVRKHVQGGWLVSVARGAFRRPGQEPGWAAVAASLEKYWGLSCHAGGRTALDLHGYAHYLALAENQSAHLYTRGRLPAWVFDVKQPRLLFHTSNLLNSNAGGVGVEKMQMDNGRFTVHVSRPERAMLELLADVPDRESFEEADKLMEGFANLSPSRLMHLLRDCNSVKVKRLFLWLAERHSHVWFGKLDTEKIDLGSGKRMLVKGGRLVSKYRITVPGEMIDGPE